MTSEAYQGSPRLGSVRIDVDGKSCQFITDTQRVTMIPLKIRRKKKESCLRRRRERCQRDVWWRGYPDDQDLGQSVLLATPA